MIQLLNLTLASSMVWRIMQISEAVIQRGWNDILRDLHMVYIHSPHYIP